MPLCIIIPSPILLDSFEKQFSIILCPLSCLETTKCLRQPILLWNGSEERPRLHVWKQNKQREKVKCPSFETVVGSGLELVWAAICIKDISIFSIFHITVPAQTIRPCVCAHKKNSRKLHFYISLPIRWESWWVKVKCGSVIERLDHEVRSIFTLGLLIRMYFFGNRANTDKDWMLHQYGKPFLPMSNAWLVLIFTYVSTILKCFFARGPLHSITMAGMAQPGWCYVSLDSAVNTNEKYSKIVLCILFMEYKSSNKIH